MKSLFWIILLLSSPVYALTSSEVLDIRDTLVVGDTKEVVFNKLFLLMEKETNEDHEFYILNIVKLMIGTENIFELDVELTVLSIFLQFEEDER